MSSKYIKIPLEYASYDLKFLLNRGYKKKAAINLVANKYVLNKNGRNYLERKVFSDEKSLDRSRKIININNGFVETLIFFIFRQVFVVFFVIKKNCITLDFVFPVFT